MKEQFSIVFELTGLTLLTVGVWWVLPAAGLITLGIGLLLFGLAMDPPRRS